MKIKDGFVLQSFADHWVAVPVNPSGKKMVISLNRQGAFLWELFREDSSFEDALKQILATYKVEEDRARQDLTRFIEALENAGLMNM